MIPSTIAAIEKQAVEQYCFDIIEIERLSHFGSLAAHAAHLEEINALHQEMYEQEMRDRAYTDELHYLYQDESEAEYVTRIAQEEVEALQKSRNNVD